MSKIILRNPNEKYEEINEFIYDDKNNFSYYDFDKNKVEIKLNKNELLLHKISKEYELELSLKNNGYAKIITCEGIAKFDIKMVEFTQNNDNILVHYLVDGEDKVIEIIY